MNRPLTIFSKLPNTGNSIFSEMTALANKHHAINLSQGFPDYKVDPHLIDLVHQAMRDGHNQYAPMPGFLPLRERIAEKYNSHYDIQVDPEQEITITAGGTQALFTAIATLIRPGDEVLIFEPAYDSYRPAVELFGGKTIPVRLLAPMFSIDWDQVRQHISSNTKLIILNNPGNPSGQIWTEGDMKQLCTLVEGTEIKILSDEVYEHLTFDRLKHQSVLFFPELRKRSFVVASFGKLLHSTGWKLGYIISNVDFTKEFRKTHQFNVFSVNSPMQTAIANYLTDDGYYQQLTHFFEQKRNKVVQGLATSGFRLLPNQGTYFLLLNYEQLSNKNELDYAVQLTQEHGIALIPISAFYSDGTEQKTLRLCFAKKEETLDQALHILNGIRN